MGRTCNSPTVGAVSLVVIFNAVSSDLARAGDWAKIIQSSLTSLAIIGGGVFAAYKLKQFRDFQPDVTIALTVSHRTIGDSYLHLDVTASDEEVEGLYAQVFIDRDEDYLQWPTLENVPIALEENQLIIEPGEVVQHTYEFIISKDVESVLVSAYFPNPRFPKGSQSQGWGATIAYDIVG